jgi:hypothetical protein
MRPFPILASLGLAALVSVSGLALAQGGGAAKVDRVQLAVVDSGGAACPRDATLTAWAHTSSPGVVRFVIHNRGGGKTGALQAEAVAGAAGTHLATYEHVFKVAADTDTEYRAEALGSGQYSNWVALKATCGPQARTTASTAGSAGPPPARTAPASRARESIGETTAGGGAPPATTTPPATPPAQSKPNTQGGGTSKPNPSSKPNSGGDRQCGSNISSTRVGALTQEGGKLTAQVGWMAVVRNVHPNSWGDWNNARERSLDCKRAGPLWTCTASARPCEP